LNSDIKIKLYYKGVFVMAKYLGKPNSKPVAFGEEGYINLSGFTEISAESGRKGEIGITDCDGSKRVRISKKLFSALGEPKSMKVLMSDTKVAFVAVAEGTIGAYDVCKGSVIYSTELADKIIALVPDIEFKENATTRCGSIEKIQTDENEAVTVILNFD
jgi:hypothetical protein